MLQSTKMQIEALQRTAQALTEHAEMIADRFERRVADRNAERARTGVPLVWSETKAMMAEVTAEMAHVERDHAELMLQIRQLEAGV